MTASLAAGDVVITGHRGASHDAPENTLASVNLAWKLNADAVEVDVWLSRDGKIVVHHDETTKKTAGVDRKVVDQTLVELKQLDVGKWKDARWAGERMPTLAEVLETIPDGKQLFIEVKCGPEIVPELQQVLKQAGKDAKQTAVISFSYEVVTAVKRERPDLAVYWIVGLKQDKATQQWSPTVDEIVNRATKAELDGVHLGKAPIIDGEFVQTIKEAELGLFVWTVNSPDEARRLIDAGVDGLTTDRPGWLRGQLAGE